MQLARWPRIFSTLDLQPVLVFSLQNHNIPFVMTRNTAGTLSCWGESEQAKTGEGGRGKGVPSCFSYPHPNLQSPKISISSPQKVNGNSKGDGVVKSKVFKEKHGLNRNFQRGGCAHQKKPFRGGHGYFRTRQFVSLLPTIKRYFS